jgi:type III secretion system HrpB1/HrpK family protein
MDPLLTRRDFVVSLMSVLMLAIEHHQLQDSEKLLDGLRVLRPDMRELDLYGAWIQMRSDDMLGASQSLRSLTVARPAFQTGKAFLAVCLFNLSDSGWEAIANEVVHDGTDPEAMALVQGLFDPQAPHQAAVDDAETTAATSPGMTEVLQCTYAMRA